MVACKPRDAVAVIVGRIGFQKCPRSAISESGHHHARQLYAAVIKCIAFPRGHRGMFLGRGIVEVGRQKFAELGNWLFPGPSSDLCLSCILPLCHYCVLRVRSRSEDLFVRKLSVNEVFLESSLI